MVNTDYIRSIPGILTMVQTALTLCALLSASINVSFGNASFQFVFDGQGWMSLVVIVLFLLFCINLIILLTSFFVRPILDSFPKMTVMIFYGIILLVMIIVAALQSWNANFKNIYLVIYIGSDPTTRFIISAIFDWLLVVSYTAMIILNKLYA